MFPIAMFLWIQDLLNYLKWKREHREWHAMKMRRAYIRTHRCEFEEPDGSPIKI